MSLIEVKNLIKTYQSGEEFFNALDNVSLNVEKGEFVAIMGASGSGKSTMMNMLGTLDRPNSGSYYLDGIDVFSLSSDELSEIRNKSPFSCDNAVCFIAHTGNKINEQRNGPVISELNQRSKKKKRNTAKSEYGYFIW